MAMTGGTAYLVKSEKTNYGSNSWTTDLYIYVKVISQNVMLILSLFSKITKRAPSLFTVSSAARQIYR